MTTNLERAGLIARNVQLLAVNLRKVKLEADLDPLDLPSEIDLSQGYATRYEIPPGRPDQLLVFIDFKFSGSSGGQDEAAKQLANLDATYLLIYEIAAAAAYPADALQHFAELNGAYNAWPYWRELIQSATGRIGLGSIVLPVFRPSVRPVDEQAGSKAATGKKAKGMSSQNPRQR
jgi:hypothetical protein